MREIACHSPRRGQAIIASVLMGLVLLLNLLAASPSLHHCFHSDAGSAQHQCAITMFAHGQVDSAATDVPIVAPLALAGTTPVFVISVFTPAIENLPAGRAPPVPSSNS